MADNRRRRIILAVLAGGAVVGVGTALTLAAWNDSEFATGTFTAGTFNLEGSTDGETWAEHPTAGEAAVLPFDVDFPPLSPDDVVVELFAVQLDAETTDYSADVTVGAPTTTGVVTGLTYTVYEVATASCADLGGADALATDVSFTADPGIEFTLDGAEQPRFFCFEVTAGDALTQGQEGTATWEFAATSQPL